MKTIEDKNNELLNRRELKIVVEAVKNPGFSDAEKILSDGFKADTERIVVKEIKGKFGRDTFLISAFIYKTKEDKAKMETKKEKSKAQPAKEEKK